MAWKYTLVEEGKYMTTGDIVDLINILEKAKAWKNYDSPEQDTHEINRLILKLKQIEIIKKD